jgi:Ala-tRNA(Pro) deacylase
MSTATWIRDELDQHGVTYRECHHREAFTAQAVAQQEHISGHRVAKVVVAMVDGRPVELILPASRRVVLDWVRDLLGAREARLANEEEMDRYFTGCERGAIPALRHWQDVEVLMDRTLRTSGDILFQAGTHCDAVCLRFEDWFRLVNPRVEIFSAPTHQPMDQGGGAFNEPWAG